MPPTPPRKPGNSTWKPPHPATVVQPRPAMGGPDRKPPHPATVVQPRIPHAAMVAQPRAPHPARVAQRMKSLVAVSSPEILLPKAILELPSFQGACQRVDRLIDGAMLWVVEEIESLLEICDLPPIVTENVEVLVDKLDSARKKSPKTFPTEFLNAVGILGRLNGLVFQLAGRAPRFADFDGRGKFGYHMSKIHNLPSIREVGLQPKFGASDRGSLAMSTEEQVKGSEQTSIGVVAFGATPGTFRPYINQAEDRRQMIEGVPIALKPVMLRFVIDDTIGESNIIEGADYMDQKALNSKVGIEPGMIEVLTADGWVALGSWSSKKHKIQPLRSSPDDARTNSKWEGTTVVLNWDIVVTATNGAFDELVERHVQGEAITWLEDQRDKVVAISKDKSAKYIFRGATMQTSGNPKTWAYAFSVVSKVELPKFLQEGVKVYQRDYFGPAKKFIEEFVKLES